MPPRTRRNAGFTLVELMVGMSLALIVMSAVLSSYLFLGRNLTRLANQQTIETQGRRAQAFFAQDARLASGVSSPTTTSLTFSIPAASGSTTVAYTYYAAATTVGGVSIPAYSFVRRTPAASGTPMVLVQDIVALSFAFKYYDGTGTEYTSPSSADYRLGLKQVSFGYVARTGSGANGTLTPSYTAQSPRFALRNEGLLQ